LDYYVGVDGGGTKTAICAASADSSVILSELTASASWREHGIDHVINNIKNVIKSLPLKEGGTVSGIAMGLPCYGESEEGDRELEKAIYNAFPEIPVYITNDVEAGWAGSLGLTPGINVVAGTGSIAFGKNETGETARCGGWSEFFSDEGSCYRIGRTVLEVFSKQSDGRLPKDELYEITRKKLNITNDFEIIDLIHNDHLHSRDKIAALQFISQEAALAGSALAKSLYKDAVNELCALVKAIRDKLLFKQQPFPVSYSGGLFKTGDLIIPDFFIGIEAIGGKPVTPKYEPVYGALLLAFEKKYPPGLPGLIKQLDEMTEE